MNYKDAFHKTVHSYPGGVEALAQRMGYNTGILRNKANPNSTTNVLTMDDASRAMDFTGDYSVLHALAEQHGFTLTKVEEEAPSELSVFESMTGILAQFGEFSQEVHQAFADGRLEPHELKTIEAAMFSVFRLFMQFRARLDGMAEK
jgi:hypothetical protein